MALLALVIVRWLDIEFLGHWEVRLDSGDLRRSGVVFASIPERLDAPDLITLMSAAKELGIPGQWHRALPTAPSDGDIGARHHYYTRAACWLREEPGLGKIIFSQLTEHTIHRREETEPPPALGFMWYVEYDWQQKRYVISNDRLKGSAFLAEEVSAVGYTPERGRVLERYVEENSHRLDGYAHVLVDTITSQGGSKYHWQHARVLKVLQCDARWSIGTEIDFAHINTVGDVPDGRQMLYLEHFDGPPEWWRLFEYEPRFRSTK